jgi:hypothetical protein
MRGRTAWRRGLAAAGLTATVLGAAGCSAPAAAPPAAGWHLVRQVGQGQNSDVTAAVAVSRTEGWAFSGNGIYAPAAFRRAGPAWTRVPFPGASGEAVVAAGATSPADVWAFTTGARSQALHWDGTAWTVAHSFPLSVGGAVVLGPDDVWAFGEPGAFGPAVSDWHFNGATWAPSPATGGLEGGSALSASSIWAFGGARVAHWDGRSWTFTSVAGLLPDVPHPAAGSHPAVDAIYAQSADSVWAVGNGNSAARGGPLVVLHYDGRTWSRAAMSTAFAGYGILGQLAPDGRGGLWIPMPDTTGGPGHLVHYAAGHLTAAVLPVRPALIDVESVTRVPGTAQVLAGGFTHAPGSLSKSDAGIILQLGR